MTFVNPTPPIPTIPLDPNLETPLSFGAGQPLLLLPVRLETRFFPRPDGGADLHVRVYPDAIHVDTHEPELTDAELTWGTHFWERTWRAGGDEAAARAAWHQLVERFDRPRAAWIARALTPVNIGDLPTQPIPDTEPLPDGRIEFPPVTTKAEAWMRAPIARMLPTRWWVLGYRGGRLVAAAAGSPISERLAVGPDPATLGDDPGDETLPDDDGIRWMTDFDVAVEVGMGIRLRLAPEHAQGLDFLLVFGTKASVDDPDQTRELAALLDAHHYTNGLGFTLQGTPSNNTDDDPSGFAAVDRDSARSFGEEHRRLGAGDDSSNAVVVGRALGLPDTDTLGRIANAGVREQLDARHMNRALWPTTWGYFLGQMIGGPVSAAGIAWARTHFVEHVRASGPLPALRVGRQPYGILPTTSLRLWRSAPREDRTNEERLIHLLLQLWDVWSGHVGEVPRVGRSPEPDRDVADVFATDGLSSGYAVRHLMGEQYLRQLWRYLVAGDLHNLDAWWAEQARLTRPGLARFGIGWDARLAAATYSGMYRALGGPLVQAEIPSEDAALDPNYIELLLAATDLEQLRREDFGNARPRALLYALLRHALLLAYWTAAASLRARGVDSTTEPITPVELEIVEDESLTAWRLLAEPVPGVADEPVWRFLRGLDGPPADAGVAATVAPLLELRESLEHLAGVSAARLGRLAAGTLDLCSHRFDAWATSIASRRLTELRTERPAGLVVGGYGWVVNLAPAPAPQAVSVPAVSGVVYSAAGDPGYTHAPSVAQAVTAAVLRSGHLTHASSQSADLLAVDLSSQRVRLAAWLLDGVRERQPLGALLGYRFERRLHELGLARFIAVFREVAPLVANKLPDTAVAADRPVESVAANNVVDGLVLQRKWKAAGSLSTLLAEVPVQPDAADLAQWGHTLDRELIALDDAIDAVSDALLAESVHQAVQANPTRVASTLDSIAAGEAPPPELEVVRTPRTGTALTHRLVVLLDDAAPIPPGWPASTASPRAAAEPRLNAWVASLLPDPATVRCVIEVVGGSGTVIDRRELRFADLHLSPLDVVYATVRGKSAPAELEVRLLGAAARLFTAVPGDATLRVATGRGDDWPTSDVSYEEFAEVVRAVQTLIVGLRGLDGSDLNLPEANQAGGVDIGELATRSGHAAAALRAMDGELTAWLGLGAEADLAVGHDLLERCSLLGIPGAVPRSANRDGLTAHADAASRELASRLQRLDDVERAIAAADPADSKRLHTSRLQAVFGDTFVVLPRFTADNSAELETALVHSAAVQGGDPLAAVTWCTRAARVREGVERFEAAMRYAEALAKGERLNLRVAQLPVRPDDRWVGLPPAQDRPLSSSRFSLVVQSTAALDVTRPLAGLLVDEWVEVVPNRSETTAMAFRFDQPDAAPPQSLLLAVPPDLGAAWTVHSLQQVLLETLDLARLRAVDLTQVAEVGHYLPAIYLAVNDAGETVSTDLAALA